MGALYVLDPANQALTCVAQVGFPAGALPPARMRLDEPLLGPEVVQTGRARYRGDGAPVPAASQLRLAAFGARSFVSLPVVGQGRVIGCLLLLARAPRRFGPADLSFLESAANQIGLSIENGRLYQHTRELLDEVKASEQIKDEFISIASHELRTPLTVVSGYAEMALRRTRPHPDRDADIKALEMIQLQVDRMKRLISDLLDVSRMTGDQLELRPQRLDLVALVWHVVDQQQPLAPHHPLLVEFAPAMIVGTWDAGRLEQVLLNLLNNAVKYSPQGGPVEITVSGDAGAGTVSIAIRDHGIGVPPDSLPHLFTRFYRAPNARQGRGGGLGIGLYVSHQLVRAHGGEIAVTSVPGGGATFTVRLPWRPAGAGAAPA